MISANGGLPAHRYVPQVTPRWPRESEPASVYEADKKAYFAAHPEKKPKEQRIADWKAKGGDGGKGQGKGREKGGGRGYGGGPGQDR